MRRRGRLAWLCVQVDCSSDTCTDVQLHGPDALNKPVVHSESLAGATMRDATDGSQVPLRFFPSIFAGKTRFTSNA